MESGRDTVHKECRIEGEKVQADIGGILSMESEQDRKTYRENGKNTGISLGYDISSGKVSGLASAGKSHADSRYESVTKQAGIYAGDKGFDITVKDNTYLKGAVIDSKGDAEKDTLRTGTLSWEDIENKADYEAGGRGIFTSTRAISHINPLGAGYTPTIPVEWSVGSKTYSAIAGSSIMMIKEKHDKEVNHDATNALHALSEIFDKKKVEEKSEYVNMLSNAGFQLMGDMADHIENELRIKSEEARLANNDTLAEKYEKEEGKWSESGINRIAMHGFMGTLISSEAGTGMGKGMTSAGLNALLQQQLGKIKDSEAHKIASAALGYLAGKETGAAIAQQATTFNYLTHEQYEHFLDDMKNAKTEKDKKRIEERWLQIDAQQKEKWLKQQGEGTYIDLSTIKEGDLPGIIIQGKGTGHSQELNNDRHRDTLRNGILDKSKEIAVESAAGWSAANWLESKYPYLTREEAEAEGKALIKRAGPYIALGTYIHGVQENHARFTSFYDVVKADALDVIPLAGGVLTGVVAGSVNSIIGVMGGLLVGAYFDEYVNEEKTVWRKMRNILILRTITLLSLKEKVKNEI